MSSPLERIANSILGRLIKEGVDRIFKSARKEPSPNEPPPEQGSSKNHPWRFCPLGESWVRTHSLTVPASSKSPEYKTVRSGNCRQNKGSKEIYTADEFREIAALYFKSFAGNLNGMPIPEELGFPDGNKYDLLIAGWTKFWNEIFKPSEPLTPDFVKALIATESGFKI